jgi:hypothetical protein
MGRKYTAVLDAVSISAVCDIFFLAAPSDAVVVLHEVAITQDQSETSEQLPLNIFRTATDNSANGTSNTPAPLEAGDAAFGGTVRTNITAASLSAETTMLARSSQNVLGGWHFLWTPETRPVLSPSGKLAVKVDAAPGGGNGLTFSGYLTFEEIGG